MRTILSINREWFYKSSFSPEDSAAPITAGTYQAIGLPHTNIELPYNYFDDTAFCFVSCYKRRLDIDPQWRGKRIFLDFEGVMSYARVFLNGRLIGEHKGGYTPFSIELTEAVAYGGENLLTVAVDSSERPDTPPFGATIDYLTYGGIYREAALRVVSPVYIEDVFVTTPDALADSKQLRSRIQLSGVGLEGGGYTAEIALYDGETRLASTAGAVAGDGMAELSLTDLEGIQLWCPEHPQLYGVVCILQKDGAEIDRYPVRMGFRDVQFRPEGFFLNGQRIQLTGLNRHQAYPYMGYAMPGRVQRRDADILKFELGLNTVRTCHYPQSRHFLDRCDEIGLLVFEEIPGWQHIGDEEWQLQALQDVEAMIVNHRNHPSIYLWGVRINESPDHHSLYTRTNALARELDSTRPTAGVRYIAGSEFLEDVYTMNDFIHDNGYGEYLSGVIRDYKTYDHLQGLSGKELALRKPRVVTGLDRDVSYMVTEFCGHMYPTKRFDQEERAVEHALRHARVQNAAHGDDGIAGAIGWCAFDYNTHADFGSGDKICYHGVMDMFRIPKFAAYAYASQQSPQVKAILEPATYWARGERSVGGVIPLVIFTNCDEVEFFYGGQSKGRFLPNRKEFPALAHPPVVVDEMTGEWGMHWEDATLVGYVGGREVIRRQYSRNPVPGELTLVPDDTALQTGDWDATRILIRVSDQLGNPMPFFHEPVTVAVEGVGQLIGPAQLTLIGGLTAVWVKTTGEPGEIRVAVSCPLLSRQAETVLRVEG